MSGFRHIPTPCVKVCVIEPTSALCRGCKRSLREIAAWGSMPDEMRERIMGELAARIIPGPTTAA